MNKSNTASDASSINEPDRAAGVNLLAELRRLMPIRRLAYYEHLLIAERQATRLLSLLHQGEPGVSLDWLSNGFDNLQVVMLPRWRMEGMSGISKWQDGRWIIGVNKGQVQARRRFTLCHEFKHVVDGNRDKITYAALSEEQREHVADYFAACYLMPKTFVRRAWTHGLQDTDALAGLFKVSVPAMRKRLTYLQYIDSDPDRSTSTYFRQQSDHLNGSPASEFGWAA